MEQVKNYYKRFVKEGFDENGILNKFEIDCPDNYNFGYDIIDKFGEIDPDRRALIHIDLQENRHDFSYSQLSKLSTQAANLFASYGIKKGDKVMLVLKRNYQFWIAIIGLIKLGAVAIPATHLLTTHDFTYRFERASVKAIVCTGYNPDIAVYVDEAQEEIHADGLIKFMANGHKDGWVSFDDEIKKMPETMERVQTDTREHMLLYFTSGTTGYPKMVVHNHRYALAHIQTAAHWQNVDPDGVHLTISDTGWGKAAWGKLFGQMSVGACVFVYDFDKFIPTDMLRIMQNYKITSFCAPPTMFRFFIKEGLENYDLSSLKYSAIAGEALNPEVYNKWLEYTGLKLMEAFGQTESTALLANLVGMTPKPGSMGKPTPLYDVDVVDDNGNPVPAGEVGEIVVRAERGKDGLFEGYYRDEELTNQAWHDGLYHTGDTAWKDEDGYFWYVGRNDDVIKSSGYRIGPFEIESVLIAHPSVLECAITGAPDPIRGQVVKATVVLARGYEPSEELKKELQTFVKKNTAPYKYPRIVEFVDELPKTISGKIRRVQIRNEDNKKNS
ncbi:MAG: AMP-binding protein [Ruminiclostridium sp.]